MEKLKACPFCGSEYVGLFKTWYILCNDCFAQGPNEDTESGAVAAWNNRPNIDES